MLSLLASVITAATPLLLAALGELVVETAGVLNLGVEGTMLVGAVAGFAAATVTGSAVLGIAAAALAGASMSALFAVLTLGLSSNQVATGLALTTFGVGLSALAGAGFVGHPLAPLPRRDVPVAVLRQDGLVYFSLVAVAGVAWFLGRSRGGLVLRAVGDADGSAHALGYGVLRIRAWALLFGGAMSGLAGAYLFGTISILQLYLQGSGVAVVPTQFLAMLPYLATIAVLVLISGRGRFGAPACLGRPFRAAT